MPDITQGTRPIPGVYVRGRLATGVYIGQQAIWPTSILGASNLGAGRFAFGGRGLLAGTGNNLHIAQRTLAFTGRPLQSAISRALRVDVGRGATLLAGRGASIAASAEPSMHTGALAVGAQTLSVISGHVIPAITGSLHFAGQPLPKVSGNEVAAYVSPGALQFATLAAMASAAAATTVGNDTLAFSGATQLFASGSGLAVALAPSAVVLTGESLGVGTTVSASIGVDAVAFQGAVLYPPADVIVSVSPESVSIWGHYTDVDTSPYALRRVGVRSATSTIVPGTTQLPLPVGAKPDDIAFIARRGPPGADEPAPDGATTLENQLLTLYQKQLDAADIANGYVVAQTDGVAPFAVQVFSGADTTLDALGTYSTTTSPASESGIASVSIPGITVSRPGSIPLAAVAANNAGGSLPSPTGPWIATLWNTGAGWLAEPPVEPGAVDAITCNYSMASSSGSSTAGAVMLAVRPLYVNATLDMGAGAVDMTGALATTPFSDPDVGLSINPGSVLFAPEQIVGNQDTPQIARVGTGVVYNAYTDPQKVTQIPLPTGTQAGDYMFLNIGAASYDPNNAPSVPRDSQAFISIGTHWRVLAYWVPIIQRDVDLGYVEADARASAAFTYIVYRGAARQLQDTGGLADIIIDPEYGLNSNIAVPGIDGANASGAALIALSTTNAVDPDTVYPEGVGLVATGWSGVYAINAYTFSGGGVRSGVLGLDPQIARYVPDTMVGYGPGAAYNVVTSARMFAVAPAVKNAVLTAGAARIALRAHTLDIESVAAGGDVQTGILPGAVSLADQGLTVTTEAHPDSLQDIVAGSLALTGFPLEPEGATVALQVGAGAIALTMAAPQLVATSWRDTPSPVLALGHNAFSIPANTTQTLQATLPAGTSAGDSIVCSVYTNDRNTTVVTPPAGATSIYPSTSNPAVVPSQFDDAYTATKFAVVVSATDVANGYIGGIGATNASTTKASAGGCYSVRASAPFGYSGGAANAWMEFRQDQPKSGSAGTATAPSDNAVALNMIGAGAFGSNFVVAADYTYLGTANTFDAPTGQQTKGVVWIKDGIAQGTFTTSLTYPAGPGTIASYDTVLLSLIPLVPGPFIAVHSELPDAIPVSASFNGAVLTANERGATGTLALTADAGWITVGTPTDNGDGSSTWPITGDAPAAGSLSVTFTATNGSQTSKLTHTFAANDDVGPVVSPSALSFAGAKLGVTVSRGVDAAVAPCAIAFTGATLETTGASPVTLPMGAAALSVTGQTLVENVGAAGGTVDFVGACTPTYGAISSIALPPGCAAGDTMLIVYHSGNSGTITPPAGSTAIVADSVYTSGRHVRVYGYRLTSADVTAGSVSLSVSSYAITPAVFRGVDVASMVDVQGTFNVMSGNRPVIITANGITTTTSGDMLIFCGAVASTGGAIGTFTAPSDYGSVNNTNNSSYATILAYQPQAIAGATGDVSAQFSNSNFGTSAGVLIALRA